MVIQRWQSVLLLVAAVMMGVASFATLAQINATDFTYLFSALGVKYAGIPTEGAPTGYVFDSWTLFVMGLASAILPFIAIFLFRNLKRQMRVVLISILFCLTFAAIAGVSAYDFADGASVIWNQTVCAPLLALVAEVMAWQRINSDKNKILATDRIR